MNIAAKVRLAKERHPDEYCPDKRCLWRTVTRNGYKPCPHHPLVQRAPRVVESMCEACDGDGKRGSLPEDGLCRCCHGTGTVPHTVVTP